MARGAIREATIILQSDRFLTKGGVDDLVVSRITLAGTNRLTVRYKEIVSRLQHLAGLAGEPLVDALFSDGVDATKLLRDSVLQIIEDDMNAAAMLERLRTFVTQPEMPEDEDQYSNHEPTKIKRPYKQGRARSRVR